MDRRNFIKTSFGTCLIARSISALPPLTNYHPFQEKTDLSQVEAWYYQKHPDREIECLLCPRQCKIGDKERGYCGVRENLGGIYYTLVYGKACASYIDPIEKKPLFHFLPGTQALSIATAGCNVNCMFCQNWEISQVRPEQIQSTDLPPSSLVRMAKEHFLPTIAYTYTEPVVFFEYMVDTARLARKEEIRSVVITGGHINVEPLQELIDCVDAVKVDLKAFSQPFYTKYVRGELKPVQDAIKKISRSGQWLEIVYLVIPTLNDDPRTLNDLCRWLMDEVGPDVPLHFNRYYPKYLLKNIPPTPIPTLERARDTAMDWGIHFVYIGNVPGHAAGDTFCPKCKNTLLQRRGFLIRKNKIVRGVCSYCGTPIAGIWD